MSTLMTVHLSFFFLLSSTESMKLKEAKQQRRHFGALPPPPTSTTNSSLTWTTDLTEKEHYHHHHPQLEQPDHQMSSCLASPSSPLLDQSDHPLHHPERKHPLPRMPAFRRVTSYWASLLLLSSLLLSLLCTSCLAQYRPNWPSPFLQREIFVLNLEDGYFGCQVNESTDFLQLFELSKLCDGHPQCFQGSDEVVPELKCTDRSKSLLWSILFCILNIFHLCRQVPSKDAQVHKRRLSGQFVLLQWRFWRKRLWFTW